MKSSKDSRAVKGHIIHRSEEKNMDDTNHFVYDNEVGPVGNEAATPVSFRTSHVGNQRGAREVPKWWRRPKGVAQGWCPTRVPKGGGPRAVPKGRAQGRCPRNWLCILHLGFMRSCMFTLERSEHIGPRIGSSRGNRQGAWRLGSSLCEAQKRKGAEAWTFLKYFGDSL